MSNKTHLVRQNEAFEEQGFMIVDQDPEELVENMTWFNTQEQRFKIRRSGVTRIISCALFTVEQELAVDNILNGAKFNNYYTEKTEDFTITYQNFFDGLEVRLLVKNNSINTNKITDITLPGADSMVDGNYFILKSAKNEETFHVWYNFDGLGLNEPLLTSTPIPVEVTPGIIETSEIIFPAASSIVSGQYFRMNSLNNINEYYVWFNKDGLGGNPGVNPPLDTMIGIQIDINSSNTASEIAELTKNAIDILADFNASFIDDTVMVSNNSVGIADPIFNNNVNGLIVNRIAIGTPTDTANDVAIATASAINALPNFSCNIPVGDTVTITNSNPGSSEDPENVNIPSGFSFNVTTQGTGPILVILPSNSKSDYINNLAFVPAQTQRFFSIIKAQNFYYVKYVDFPL
jgi:hypothetical protein